MLHKAERKINYVVPKNQILYITFIHLNLVIKTQQAMPYDTG